MRPTDDVCVAQFEAQRLDDAVPSAPQISTVEDGRSHSMQATIASFLAGGLRCQAICLAWTHMGKSPPVNDLA